MGVIQIWGLADTRSQRVQRDSQPGAPPPQRDCPPTRRTWQGGKRGLPYPWSCHLERARRNPLCEGTLRHTQGLLEGRRKREILEVAGVGAGAAVPHTFKNLPACLLVFPHRLAYPQVPGGSSPRGSVRLEALSLRAGPDGMDGSS